VDTTDPRLWFDLGVGHAAHEHFDKAILAYRHALTFRPSFPEAWYNLGIAYGCQKRYGEALAAFREAIQLRPDYVKAWFNLGVACAIHSDTARVLKVYEQLKLLDPTKSAEFYEKVVRPHEGGDPH